jgi:hypothetical protein
MGYREARELARIRQELRERLMSGHHDGCDDVLGRLQLAAEQDRALLPEYERWRLRFDLLIASASLRPAA